MQDIAILPLGGCLMEVPLAVHSAQRGEVRAIVGSGGPMPLTHSIGDMAQLVRYLRGETIFPAEVKLLAGIRAAFEPANDLGNVDVALIEPNTPIEIVYGDFLLQRNAILSHIVEPVCDPHPDPAMAKMGRNWFMNGLVSGNETIRAELGPRLAALVPDTLPMADVARDVLLHARGERREILPSLRQLLALLDLPTGVVTFVYRYMPDGRPIGWPAGFRDGMLTAARSMGLPLYEPWRLVNEIGVETALSEDLRHYSDAFMLPVGEAIVAFAREVRLRRR